MWFTSNKVNSFDFVVCDIHSHLLPLVDDGVNSYEMGLYFIQEFKKLGYKKLILTPHIYKEFYPNTKKDLESKFEKYKTFISESVEGIELYLGAEYYLDEYFDELVELNDLLTIGKTNFVLVETSFASLPLNFENQLFSLMTNGYVPILAHPERYTYLIDSLKFFNHLVEIGVKLQINLSSLTGYHGRIPQEIIKYLLKENLVSFLGSDLHHDKHLNAIKKVMDNTKLMNVLKNKKFLNATLP